MKHYEGWVPLGPGPVPRPWVRGNVVAPGACASLMRSSGRSVVTQVETSFLCFGELSSLLTVKTLTGMTTDVYPRENCIAPAMVFVNLALY